MEFVEQRPVPRSAILEVRSASETNFHYYSTKGGFQEEQALPTQYELPCLTTIYGSSVRLLLIYPRHLARDMMGMQ